MANPTTDNPKDKSKNAAEPEYPLTTMAVIAPIVGWPVSYTHLDVYKRQERTRRQDPSKASELERWVDSVPAVYRVLPMDIACFREWGRIMDKKPPELLQDAMIAATARVHRLVVATRNERDFERLEVRTFNPFKN